MFNRNITDEELKRRLKEYAEKKEEIKADDLKIKKRKKELEAEGHFLGKELVAIGMEQKVPGVGTFSAKDEYKLFFPNKPDVDKRMKVISFIGENFGSEELYSNVNIDYRAVKKFNDRAIEEGFIKEGGLIEGLANPTRDIGLKFVKARKKG